MRAASRVRAFTPSRDLLYRRTPVLQIGVDIHCDTAVILRAIERLHPEPSLFPAGTEGLATAIAWWWERTTWNAAVGLLGALIGDKFPEAFIRDRKEGYLGYDMSKPAMLPLLPWMERIAALGHGSPTELSRAEALRIAAAAQPAPPALGAAADLAGLAPGQRVTVTPDDNARVPVLGVLLGADAQEVVIRRSDPEAGELNLHVPRAGFEVLPAPA